MGLENVGIFAGLELDKIDRVVTQLFNADKRSGVAAVFPFNDDDRIVVLVGDTGQRLVSEEIIAMVNAWFHDVQSSLQLAASVRLAAATMRSTLGRYFISRRYSGMCVS